MVESELRQLVKEVFRGFTNPTDLEPRFTTQDNQRMFDNLKKRAEELHKEYTQSGRVPGFMGIDRDTQKWKDVDELNQVVEWYEVWSRTLKTAKTYNDLIQTLDLLPARLQPKFKSQLLKVK